MLESATLAGVLHAPELYDPIDRPEDNRFRRDYALDQMVRYGYLDAAEAERLKDRRVLPDRRGERERRLERPRESEYFVDYVRQDLFERENYGSARVYGGGLRITTTLDLDLQRRPRRRSETAPARRRNDPRRRARRDRARDRRDPGDGRRPELGKSKFNLATFRGGTGRAGRAPRSRRSRSPPRWRTATTSEGLERTGDARDPDCPDRATSDGDLASRERRGLGDRHARERDRVLGQHRLRAADRAARPGEGRRHGPLRSGSSPTSRAVRDHARERRR